MDEQVFWSIVASVGWGKGVNCGTARVALVRELGRDRCAAFRETYDRIVGALDRVLAKPVLKVAGYLGESFDDLCAHIVGLGRDEYEATLRDPSRGVDRYRRGDFVESFAYCVPWPRDLEMLEVAHHAARAEDLLVRYRKALRQQRGDAGKIGVVVAALELLAATDVQAFLSAGNAAKTAATEVATALRAAATSAAGPRATVIFDGGDITNPHGVINLVNDVELYLAPTSAEAPSGGRPPS